jgi:hypothetical protein
MIQQYLLSRSGKSQQQIIQEMNEFYDQACWDLQLTKYNKVKSAKLRENFPKPVVKQRKPRVVKPVKPKVVIKKRRTISHIPPIMKDVK